MYFFDERIGGISPSLAFGSKISGFDERLHITCDEI
jgi:hypothetical protein